MCVFVLFVRVKSFRFKNKTALIPSFILLLTYQSFKKSSSPSCSCHVKFLFDPMYIDKCEEILISPHNRLKLVVNSLEDLCIVTDDCPWCPTSSDKSFQCVFQVFCQHWFGQFQMFCPRCCTGEYYYVSFDLLISVFVISRSAKSIPVVWNEKYWQIAHCWWFQHPLQYLLHKLHL